MKKAGDRVTQFKFTDVAEIVVGGSVMAFPVAVTEDIWKLGTELSMGRVLLFTLSSLIILAILIYLMHGHGGAPPNRKAFWQRVLTTYFLTLLISALLLFGVDRLKLLSDPLVGIKRTILVAFPASFAATVVDSFSSN